jgi:hypothetical protein
VSRSPREAASSAIAAASHGLDHHRGAEQSRHALPRLRQQAESARDRFGRHAPSPLGSMSGIALTWHVQTSVRASHPRGSRGRAAHRFPSCGGRNDCGSG